MTFNCICEVAEEEKPCQSSCTQVNASTQNPTRETQLQTNRKLKSHLKKTQPKIPKQTSEPEAQEPGEQTAQELNYLTPDTPRALRHVTATFPWLSEPLMILLGSTAQNIWRSYLANTRST